MEYFNDFLEKQPLLFRVYASSVFIVRCFLIDERITQNEIDLFPRETTEPANASFGVLYEGGPHSNSRYARLRDGLERRQLRSTEERSGLGARR